MTEVPVNDWDIQPGDEVLVRSQEGAHEVVGLEYSFTAASVPYDYFQGSVLLDVVDDNGETGTLTLGAYGFELVQATRTVADDG